MKAFLGKLKNYLIRNGRILWWFWKYALLAKLHFWNYRSDKVIMLRLDLIGDCTMFTSAAKTIREFYADKDFTVVCLSISQPIFERLGIFDHIISVDFRPESIDYKKLRALTKKIRKEKYHILLQPQVSKLPIADILGAVIRCNQRIAIETKPGNSSEKWVRMTDFLYDKDKRVPYPRGIVSEFDYYGTFVRGIGVVDYQTKCPDLHYYAQSFVEGSYYVLYPGASYSQKVWPPERFAKLADHVFERTGMTGVILGSESDRRAADIILSQLRPQTEMSIISLIGKTTVFDVIDIIGNAKLVISNDTSGVHIACATRTPSVVNAGGWHFERFLPYHIEDVHEDDKLPLVAYTLMPCYQCDLDWSIVEERNKVCIQRLRQGESCECIDQVSYEQMRILVDRVIERERLDVLN